MTDKAIIAACMGAVLAAMFAGFSYIWGHVEDNSVNSKTARILQKEIVVPTLKDHESRLRDAEKCGQECD